MLNTLAAIFAKIILSGVALLMLTACSPQYDWRQIQGEGAPFSIAMPAKPTTFSRQIDLHGTAVRMTMTAAEIGSNTFAIGTAELPDAIQAQRSLQAMQTALVNNIAGTIRQQKVSLLPRSTQPQTGAIAITEIEAVSANQQAIAGQPRILYARFAADDKRIYQLVATGPEQSMTRDLALHFFTSFRLN